MRRSGWSIVRVGLATIVVMIAAAGASTAQVFTDGSIRGYVRDEQGAVLPGATLTATSPQAPVPATAVTDRTGHYRLEPLLPGTYRVTVQLQGFATYLRENVEVRVGLNLELDAMMKVGGLSDSVTVTADAPMLESRSATQTVNVSGTFQTSLPTSNRANWSDVLTLMPGTVVYERGGEQSSATAFYVHGSGLESHVIQIDGVDVSAGIQGSTRYHFISAGSLADTQVKLAGVDAASPLGTGAIINMVTRSGTNQVKGGFAFAGQNRKWTGSNVASGTSGKIDLLQPELWLGGPIVRERAWFFASYRYSSATRGVVRNAADIQSVRSVFPDAILPDFRATSHQVLANLSFKLSPRQMVTATVNSGRERNNFQVSAPRVVADTIRNVTGGEAISLQWRGAWSDALSTRLAVAYQNIASTNALLATGQPRREIYQTTTLSSGTLQGNTLLAVFDSNARTGQEQPGDMVTVTADANYSFTRGWGSHDLQVGTYLQPRRRRTFNSLPSNGGFVMEQFVLRDPSNPGLGFVPFRQEMIDPTTPESSDVHITDYAFYVQDSWRPTGRLTVNAGVRVDFINRSDRIANVPLQDTTAVGPRLGVNYALTADGGNIARASWARIHANPSEAAVTNFGGTSAARQDLYDLDLNGTFETTLVTPARTTVAANRTVDLAGFRQPHAAEWTLGYQRQLPGRTVLDIGVVHRAFRNQLVNVEINGVYEDGVFKGYRDESLNDVQMATSNSWNWPLYTGISVTGTKRTSDVQLIASYTRQFVRLAGTWQPNDVSSFLQPDAFPNDKLGDRGRRDHLVALGASYSYQGPWGFDLATQLNLQSGQWSGPVTMQIPASDAVGPPTVSLSNGRVVSNPLATRTRFAFATRGDRQLKGQGVPSWNIRVGRKLQLHGLAGSVWVDILNVLNTGRSDVIASASMANANFGTLAATRMPPRAVQGGLRFEF